MPSTIWSVGLELSRPGKSTLVSFSVLPTGPRLLEKFATLCIVIIQDTSGTHRRLAQLSNTQREILKLLDLPDTAGKTFKRRCGT
jgi:hypothetical protein